MLSCLSSHAGETTELGRRFYRNGEFKEAINEFSSVTKTHPRDADAWFWLGKSYLKLGMHERAEKQFLESFFLEIENGGGDSEIVEFLPEGKLVAEVELRLKHDEGLRKIYSEAALRIFDVAKKEFLQGYPDRSSRFFFVAAALDSETESKVFNFYIDLADASDGAEAESFYDFALEFAQTDAAKRELVAYRWLKLAPAYWPGKKCENLKEKAALIIGPEKVSKIFPPPKHETTFEKTYTAEDAVGEHGQIETVRYGVDDVMPGDQIEVVVSMKDGGPLTGAPIQIWRSRDGYSMWLKIIDGHYVETLERTPAGFSFVINLGKRDDVEVKIKVTRLEEQPPQLQFLD